MSNTICGSSQVRTAVQARDIHTIHFHPERRTWPTPRQLPAVPRVFTDRTEGLAFLDTALADPPPTTAPVAVISGPDGVGKRTLAARWGHRAADRYPDGQLVARLRAAGRPAPVAEVTRALLRALGLGDGEALPWHTEELLALWRSVSATRRLLVVLEDTDAAEQVLPLVPASSQCAVVVTSTVPLPALAAHGARHHRLEALSAEHTLLLLGRIVGGHRVHAEPEAAAALARACGGMPLAVGLAAGEAVLDPARPLGEHPALAAPTTVEAVTMTTALAYESLPEPEARLLRLLALLPAPDVDVLTAAAATATPVVQTGQLLQDLTARSLLEHSGRAAGRGEVYRLRPALRDQFRATAVGTDSNEIRTMVVQRYLDVLIATAHSTVQQLTPHHRVLPRHYRHLPSAPVAFDSDQSALAWLEGIAPAVQPALDAAWQLGEHRALVTLVHDLWPLFHRLRRVDLSVAAHEKGLRSAKVWGDRMAIREMTTTLALALKGAGRHDEAGRHYREALDLAIADGDRSGIAQCTMGIGSCLWAGERYADAMPFLREAADLYDGLEEVRGGALADILLGSAAARQGDPDDGMAPLSEAHASLALLRPPDPLNAGRALAFLGEAHSLAGRHDLAVVALTEAQRTFEDIGHAHWLAHTFELLGQDAERAGATEAALGWYTASLDRYATLASFRDMERLDARITRANGP
ncbi:tetratricopeptide repeat protein [Kitasatospora sp. NPDC048296]|uniref:tetratricopeptide repeat protein n=1 Tax=Kitasatospora sp. NPDC048296 TaxID=3364048 RepID=UPI003710AB81